MRAAFIYCQELQRFAYPPQCPFSTARAGLARDTLASMGLLAGQGRREVPTLPARREELLEFHTPRYLDLLQQATRGSLDEEGLAMGLGTEDTPIFADLYEYATLAVGGTLTAANMILSNQADVAFNPSGGYHHAHPARASGFCYLNDVVLACLRLAGAGKRVAFLDVDAHHCDGVQEAFFRRSDVMVISLHESGKTLFPGTGFEDEIGAGAGEGFTANLPLPAGVYDDAYIRAFEAVALPLLGAYDPDVIVLELGMDGLAGDPLTHLALTNNAHAQVVRDVRAFGKPILATGGGGYHIKNSARGFALAWTVLCGQDDPVDDLSVGLGGVLLETTEWLGGLKDRRLVPDERQKAEVDAAVDATVERVKKKVFPYHGL
jgi:acetoin utilization protein AcuC